MTDADQTDAGPAAAIERAPLVTAWRTFVESGPASFTIPGHKRLAGSLSPTLGQILDADVPLYGGLDTVKLDSGVLARAESAAAALWGADWCRFSTGGSTHANQAVTLAVGRPGDTVLVARTAHRSTLLGLVLAGLIPVWLPVDLDPRWGIPTGLSPVTLRAAVASHPEAVAVLCVEPGYLGTLAPVGELAEIAHGAGLPLIVDQAWGAHLGFHPDYPRHALQQGADVLVTSAHKALPAFSQASMLMTRIGRFGRFDAGRWERAFEAGNTTSPSGAILASIDASRALLADPAGPAMLGRLAELLSGVRDSLRASGFGAPGPEDFAPGRFDPAKLVIRTDPIGRSGVELESGLIRAGLPVEMADRDTIVPMIGLVDTRQTLHRFVETLLRLAESSHRRDDLTQPETADPVVTGSGTPWSVAAALLPPAPMTPRAAFFAPREALPLDAAVGRICAEVVAPYPPGIPVLVPGEEITTESVTALMSARAAGTRIAYAADPALRTVEVVTQ